MTPSAALAALIITAVAGSAVASEYNCVRGDQAARRVEVVSKGPTLSAPCQDIEQLGVRNVLWNAQIDAEFCRRRTEESVAALQEGGRFCTAVEGATTKAVRETVPSVAEPAPDKAGTDTARARGTAGPNVTSYGSEEKPETAKHSAPAWRASLTPTPSGSRRRGSATEESEPGVVAFKATIEQNSVRLNDGMERQYAAGIVGDGALDEDGLKDGPRFRTYDSERLAQAHLMAAYLYDGESYAPAPKPVASSDDNVRSEIAEIENGVISVRLRLPGPDDASCCPSGARQQRLVLRGGQLVEVSSSAGPSPSSGIRGTTGGSTGGATTSGETSGTGSSSMPGCLGMFTGPLTKLDQNYGYNTTKIATWPNQARFDARGGTWESYMKGHYAANSDNRRNVAPIQFGVDWGTNIKGAGRTDVWYSNTPFNTTPLCFYGGIVVGRQPEGATWGETKMDGGGYAITINSKNAIVEGMRVHNHHDGFVPYRSDGFTYRGNWQSYTRDDCIENDAGAEGTVTDNLFDGCFVFFSNTGGAAGDAAGRSGTLRITNNLIKMEPMPGPPFGGAGVEDGDPSITSHGVLFKVQPDDEDTIPQIILRDNVIAYMPSGAKNTLKSLGRIAEHQSTLTSRCSNNRILWFGSGSFSYAIPANVQQCFTIVTGNAAKQEWQQKRQQWLDAHPDIPRI